MTSSRTDTALVDVTMPQMGVSVAEGTVVGWRVEVGDRIGADQAICDISTDKIDTEVPAPVGGVVAEILVAVDETVDVGTVLARIATAGSGAVPDAPPGAPSATPEPSAVVPSNGAGNGAAGTPPAAGDLRRYSPVVQRIAAEHGIDLSQVKGTGRGGRVRKQDVLALVDDGGAAASGAGDRGPAAAHREPVSPGPGSRLGGWGDSGGSAGAAGGGQLSRMRRQIGEHMKRSLETAATCTTWIEVDMSRVEAARKRLGVTGWRSSHGP